MYLFICEEYKNRGSTDELVLKSLDILSGEKNLDFGEKSGEILRTGKGKPYFKEIPVSFSVSHTGNIWVCLMQEGKEPVGVDIQTMKEYSYEKIAKRYYTETEQQRVAEGGEDEFFRIWSRKEAYAKYTGDGIGSYLADIDTLDNDEVVFTDIEICEGVKGACCIKEEGQLWIRKI